MCRARKSIQRRENGVRKSRVQITFDCAGPEDLARFWAEVLGYPPPDVERLHARYREAGTAEEDLGNWCRIGDPSGPGPPIFFQKAPRQRL
jgi:Glyoxalase-like domain